MDSWVQVHHGAHGQLSVYLGRAWEQALYSPRVWLITMEGR